MTDQYFNQQPESSHQYKDISTILLDSSFEFKTDAGVFSKNRVDFGSKVLIEAFVENFPVLEPSSILELGSGYGPISIILGSLYPQSRVLGLEINERAYHLAQENKLINKSSNVEFLLADVCQYSGEQVFDFVITNPPIRAGKKVIQEFVNVAYDKLKPEGSLWLVIQKKQGAPSMKNYMEEKFGNADRITMNKGYWIIKSVKD